MDSNIISQEVIETFLNGEDPEKYIVGVEYDYRQNKIFKIIQDPVRGKIVREDKLTPFLWVSDLTHLNFYDGSKARQKMKMGEHGITIKKLRTDGNEKLEAGPKFLVKCSKGYRHLLDFFKQGGVDPWGEETKKYFTILNVVEQFLIQSKKRLFKGIDEYDDVHRFMFDIETTGLNPKTDKIILIGVKDNRGFRELIPAFGEDGEKKCIIRFFETFREVLPSIIAGYNSADFDFTFIEKRAEILGVNIREYTDYYDERGLQKREGLLKLGGEVEPFNKYSVFGFTIVDISHSVRRAQAINSNIKSWGLKYITDFIDKKKPNRVYVDGAFISKIYLENKEYYMNPRTGNYKLVGSEGTEGLMEKYPGKFEIWTGKDIVKQYLDDDLYETMVVDDSFSQSTFLLSKLVPTTYDRLATMGTATLWKLIMLAWSYENDLAVPVRGEKRKFTGGLSRLLNVGYAQNVVKFDYSSLYPSIQLVYDIFPTCDIMNVQKSLLKYFRDVRIKYKLLGVKYEKTNPNLSDSFNRKQLPIKIFINGYFGSLSAPHIFPWGDVDKGEMVTCMGRQSLRMMIMWFRKRGYKPLVMDTDGVNFAEPKDISEVRYVGKGLNELVEKGKEYTGVPAHVAEFNDIFMRNEMGLDIDGIYPATVNISRKNYIIKKIKKDKVKIEITGNTIKSKKLPTYVEKFFDKAFLMLLDGDGEGFLDFYYSYIDKIYNQEIPLVEIANKSRVKMSNKQYQKHILKKTKSGNSMSRQAHMELILANDYQASLGETIYYINNGQRKSHGDVKKLNKPSLTFENRQEKRDWIAKNGKIPLVPDGIQLNCYMIDSNELINNPDKTGEYNIERYLANFNKRVAPLLVVFHPDIRDEILITDPQKRPYFTPAQSELDSGHAIKEGQQDSIDEVLTLSESEAKFWHKMGVDPYHIYLEDSVKEVDENWVNFNRDIVKNLNSQVKDEKDDMIDNDGHDYALHTDLYSDDK